MRNEEGTGYTADPHRVFGAQSSRVNTIYMPIPASYSRHA
jgi:hypothetical protein